MTSYTRGDWSVAEGHPSTTFAIVEADGVVPVASCFEGEADAHLIAAAPDMREALSRLTALLARVARSDGLDDATHYEAIEAINLARAALAKGEPPTDPHWFTQLARTASGL